MKMNPKLNSFILNICNKNLLVASYLYISLPSCMQFYFIQFYFM